MSFEELPVMDPVQHLREITNTVDDAVVSDEEITAWIAEGGPSHAYTKVLERLA